MLTKHKAPVPVCFTHRDMGPLSLPGAPHLSTLWVDKHKCPASIFLGVRCLVLFWDNVAPGTIRSSTSSSPVPRSSFTPCPRIREN